MAADSAGRAGVAPSGSLMRQSRGKLPSSRSSSYVRASAMVGKRTPRPPLRRSLSAVKKPDERVENRPVYFRDIAGTACSNDGPTPHVA